MTDCFEAVDYIVAVAGCCCGCLCDNGGVGRNACDRRWRHCAFKDGGVRSAQCPIRRT